jgi:hypothetical protein
VIDRQTRVVTRRALLARGAALGVSSSLAAKALAAPRAALAARPSLSTNIPIPLPSPQQVRADFTRMVQFGPRLTGSDNHNRYIAWLEREFTNAGLTLDPCDVYETERWLAQQVGLTMLDGASAGPVMVGGYYPRSLETPIGGVTGPLVYGGAAPALSVSGTDLGALAAAIVRYPNELASWASALAGTLAGLTAGSILLVDLPLPVPLTAAAFVALATYLNWPGHGAADWATSDYKRLWIEPGLGVPLAPFQALGAAGVVFILESSYAALKGAYLPFGHGFEPLPALYVDRDTGGRLRAQASARPHARLTLTATREKVPSRAVTAVLPGTRDDAIIFNTHTDGQGFAEENAGVAFVQLARYFGSLPAAKRLKRTLVFAAWPGHMAADLPQTQGWIDAHPEIVKRAVAALTVEHLGCSEFARRTGRHQEAARGSPTPTRRPLPAWQLLAHRPPRPRGARTARCLGRSRAEPSLTRSDGSAAPPLSPSVARRTRPVHAPNRPQSQPRPASPPNPRRGARGCGARARPVCGPVPRKRTAPRPRWSCRARFRSATEG